MARPTPVLKRLDITFTKSDGSPLNYQIPAGLALAEIYAVGATVPNGTADIVIAYPASLNVPVYHPGLLAINQQVQIGTSSVAVLRVDSHFAPDATGISGSFMLRNEVPATTVTVKAKDRLVLRRFTPAFFYNDPTGQETTGLSSQRNADSNGRLVAYVREPRFDMIVTVSPTDVRLFVDLEGSYVMRT